MACDDTLALDARGLTSIEMLIIISTVALLAVGIWRLVAEELAAAAVSQGNDIARIAGDSTVTAPTGVHRSTRHSAAAVSGDAEALTAADLVVADGSPFQNVSPGAGALLHDEFHDGEASATSNTPLWQQAVEGLLNWLVPAAHAGGKGSSHRWVPSAELKQLVRTTKVKYDYPPAWNAKRCAGGPQRGTAALARRIDRQFDVESIGGYGCRRNTAKKHQMSVHGTGRALDIHVRGKEGDRIAEYLIRNAKELGVQAVIWARTACYTGSNCRRYRGPDPHTDHIHTELNRAGAR